MKINLKKRNCPESSSPSSSKKTRVAPINLDKVYNNQDLMGIVLQHTTLKDSFASFRYVNRTWKNVVDTNINILNIPNDILKTIKNEKCKDVKETLKLLSNAFINEGNRGFINGNNYFHNLPVDKLKSLANILINDTDNNFKQFITVSKPPTNPNIFKYKFEIINNLIQNHHDFFTQNKIIISNYIKLRSPENMIDFAKCQDHLQNQMDDQKRNIFNQHFNILRNNSFNDNSCGILKLFEIAPDLVVEKLNDLQAIDPRILVPIAHFFQKSPDFVREKWADLKRIDREKIHKFNDFFQKSPDFVREKWVDLKDMDIRKIHEFNDFFQKSPDFVREKWVDLKDMTDPAINKYNCFFQKSPDFVREKSADLKGMGGQKINRIRIIKDQNPNFLDQKWNDLKDMGGNRITLIHQILKESPELLNRHWNDLVQMNLHTIKAIHDIHKVAPDFAREKWDDLKDMDGKKINIIFVFLINSPDFVNNFWDTIKNMNPDQISDTDNLTRKLL